jgi:hypothetical protein
MQTRPRMGRLRERSRVQTRRNLGPIYTLTNSIERHDLAERPPHALSGGVSVFFFGGATQTESTTMCVLVVTGSKDHDRLVAVLPPTWMAIVHKDHVEKSRAVEVHVPTA